jgi:D-alanine transaminase
MSRASELIYPKNNSLPQFAPLAELPAGLLYGMAVYTTFRLPLPPVWIFAHLDRLLQNAGELGLMVRFSRQDVYEALQGYLQADPLTSQVLRLTLVADVQEYGDFYHGLPKSARLLLTVRSDPPRAREHIALKSVNAVRPIPLIKHTAMAEVILLKQQAQREGFQDILLSSDGMIHEASTANIFFIDGDCLITPEPVKQHCLPGITRQRVIQAVERQGHVMVREAPVYRAELGNFQGAFLTNAVQGISSVKQVDDVIFPENPATAAWLHTLQAGLHD